MSKPTEYLTAPTATSRMPPGVPYIIGNEAAERFSYYGMRAILFTFMTELLMDAHGQLAPMSSAQGKEWVHTFFAAVYIFPLMGSILADVYIGKYLTIMSLSIVYCLGHLSLALNDTRTGLLVGLTLIAIGSGGIKPCVSANVGDQFGEKNRHLLTVVYNLFYLAINIGSAISMMLTPLLLKNKGPHWAFATPGVLMLIATIVFWLGRKKFVHAPPIAGGSARTLLRTEGLGAAVLKPLTAYFREIFAGEGARALVKLLPIYAVCAVYWSLYDQCSSAWVEQAKHMNRHVFGVEWTADQFQVLNPILVLINVPLFSFVIYPLVGKFCNFTPLRKMSVGFFFTVLSFLVPAWVEVLLKSGQTPSISWQVLAYVFLMASEMMVYATGLEFSYRQAPAKMKSLIMALFLATNTAGNLFTAAVNHFIQNPDGTVKLGGANYYLFFAALMLIAALGFIVIAMFYRGKSYTVDAPVTA